MGLLWTNPLACLIPVVSMLVAGRSCLRASVSDYIPSAMDRLGDIRRHSVGAVDILIEWVDGACYVCSNERSD